MLNLSLSNRSSHRGRDVPTATIFPFGKLELGLHPPTLTLTDSPSVVAQPASSAMYSVGRGDVTFNPFRSTIRLLAETHCSGCVQSEERNHNSMAMTSFCGSAAGWRRDTEDFRTLDSIDK